MIIFAWVLHAFPNKRMSGKMNDRIDIILTKNVIEEIAVANVTDMELPANDRFAMPGFQAVDNDDILSSIDQLRHRMRADITGSTRYQYCQFALPPSISFTP